MTDQLEIKDQDKQVLLKQFARNYPKYLKAKKVQFPILDECLVQYSALFPHTKQKHQHPEGKRFNVFSSIPVNSLKEITTTINNFPNSPIFSEMSDTQYQSPLALTSFMKILTQLYTETHSVINYAKMNLYNTQDAQEQIDKINFKLVSFFIEDIFKYKAGLLSVKDIQKLKAQESKKEKKETKKRVSLLAIVEKQQQRQEDDGGESQFLESIQFENFADATSVIFWNLMHESFVCVQRKVAKLSTNLRDSEENESKSGTLFPIDQESVSKRRQKFNQMLNLKKFKDLSKAQQKAAQSKKRNKFDNGLRLTPAEASRFGKLFRCYSNSWQEIAIQAIKIPYVQSCIQSDQLGIFEQLGDINGYHGYTTKQRGQLVMTLSAGINDTDCFRQIVEFRQEISQEIVKELEDIEKVLNELNNSIKINGGDTAMQLNYRDIYKKYLQLIEFDSLWTNGCQYLGTDVAGKEYFIFSNDLNNLYYCMNNEWFYLNHAEALELSKSLNSNGVKERDLQRAIQRLTACELLGDTQTNNIIQYSLGKPAELQDLQPNASTIKQQIIKVLIEAEMKISQTLMMKHLRWSPNEIRKEFTSTLDQCTDPKELSQFILMFANQLENVQQLKLDPNKLASAGSFIKPIDMKYIEMVSSKTDLNENSIFQDFKLFSIMERAKVLYPTKQLQKTQFWGLGLGDRIKQLWIQYGEKLSTYQSVLCLSHFLLVNIEEFTCSLLQGEVIDDEDMKQAMQDFERQEKQLQRELNQEALRNGAVDIVIE